MKGDNNNNKTSVEKVLTRSPSKRNKHYPFKLIQKFHYDCTLYRSKAHPNNVNIMTKMMKVDNNNNKTSVEMALTRSPPRCRKYYPFKLIQKLHYDCTQYRSKKHTKTT